MSWLRTSAVKQLVCLSDALECAVLDGALLAVQHDKCSHTHDRGRSAKAGHETCVEVLIGAAGSLASEQGRVCRLG